VETLRALQYCLNRVVIAMIAQVYFVESRSIPMLPAEGLPLASEPIPVGAVQFTGRSIEWVNDSKQDEAAVAVRVLMYHSPLMDHPAHGHLTWRAKPVNVDDESLGIPVFEDTEKGHRVWLLTKPLP
jgi:hypothetical protein